MAFPVAAQTVATETEAPSEPVAEEGEPDEAEDAAESDEDEPADVPEAEGATEDTPETEAAETSAGATETAPDSTESNTEGEAVPVLPIADETETQGTEETDTASAETVPQSPPETVTSDTSSEDSARATAETTASSQGEESDDESVWEKDGDGYTTVRPVVVGETYVAPQDDDVRILFTRLPAHPGTVTIREVRLSADEQAALGALSDTAYDVTSSMKNGTFAYKLFLPIPEGIDHVRVKYAEDDTTIVLAQAVDADQTEVRDERVRIELDHFTLFIATYGEATFTVEQSVYAPGQTVYAKATDLNPNKFYRILINPPTGSSFRISEPSCFNPDASTTTLTASYLLPLDAQISDAWSAELKEYTNANCSGVTTIEDPFTVVAASFEEVDEVGDGNGNFEVTICHATPPDTAASGYNQQTVDDDSIFTTGHASEHDADIIPPFETETVSFPGKNWDAEGQAIWNNQCNAVGRLQVVKVVDDGSDLTQWQFQLNETAPVAANASGQVDFGYVPVGEHLIQEIGIASYSIVNVLGEGCVWDAENQVVTATVAAGETTTCTFSNAVNRAAITVIKAVAGDDPQDFTFTLGETKVNPVILDDDGSNENELANTGTFSNLFPGAYTLIEETIPGWEVEAVSCVSSRTEAPLDLPLGPEVSFGLVAGETMVCTYTNKKTASNGDDPYCGDGKINQESEQCDGEAGIGDDENTFCTTSCVEVPVYDGGGSCSEGTEPVKVASYFVSGTTDPDGRIPVSVPLSGGQEYLIEATGDYSYGGLPVDNTLNRADAAYSSDDNFAGPSLLNSLFGIAPGAFYRGVHTLISDMGTGTFGVVDWGSYRPDHTYPLAVTPVGDATVRFMISDWYGEWYVGDALSEPNKNQEGFRDNADGLTVNVYECRQPERGSITVIKQAEPADAQDFGFVLNPGFQEFVLDDDADALLSDTQVFTNLPAGDYSVTEGLVPGWTLESVACTSNLRSLAPTAGPTRTLDLQAGEDIVCTFTNVAKSGSITIIKDATPDDPQNFGYAMNGNGFLEFVLDDDADALLSNTATFTGLVPGTYSVTEGLVPGWELAKVSCVSNQEELEDSTDPIRTIELGINESVTCTFFNAKTADEPVCGNGILDGEGEQCDGTAGVTPGENFCTMSCKLVPIYDGGGVCGEGTRAVKVASYFVPATLVDEAVPAPVSVALTGGEEYFLEASGTFGYGGIPVDNTIHRADAAYVTDTNFAGPNLDTLFGSPATAFYRGIHNLISDNGTGTFGVVDWGSYDPGHTYTQTFSPAADTSVQYAISDWYDTWHSGDELSDFNTNQFGFRDNEGGIALNLYECQPLETPGSLEGYKWHDLNGDTARTCEILTDDQEFSEELPGELQCEPKLSGWTVFLDENDNNILDEGEVSTVTDESGDYAFGGLAPGSYRVCEVMQEDWFQTYPAQVKENLCHTVVVIPGETTDGWNFGNNVNENEPQLLLTKSNDSVGDEVPGNEVVYTLEVTVLGGPVDDVTVTDLPPEGFEYVAGSGSGAPFIHEYASPGIWDLGDMAAGETKTLTYTTVISAGQDAGRYEDLAFARGTSGATTILANAPSDPFVGTDVNVVLPSSDPSVLLDEDEEVDKERKKKTVTQYVLGASTELPLTGTPWGAAALALIGLGVGLGLRRLGRRAKTGSVVASSLLGLALILGIPAQADAANLSVDIETPQATVANPSFKLGFVALDVLTRPITVECFTTGSATPFATYNLVSTFGGNSGDCAVDASVMPLDGSYEFYVKATAVGEGDETVESSHVAVTLVSGTPDTPLNYDRNDPGCSNVITFTTADDAGKTVKVELYRSTENPFVANAATKVAEQAIGSNANGSFSVPAPGCDDDVFYAIRAVAASGKGSAFVGDTDVDTETDTVTSTQTNTVVVPGVTGAIALDSAAEAAPAGAVQGAATEAGEALAETGTGGAEASESDGSVLGDATEAATTWFGEHLWLTCLLILLALVVGFLGYRWYARNKNHGEPLA